jgi:hypothetical protein
LAEQDRPDGRNAMIAAKPSVETMRVADLTLDKTIQMRASLNRTAILDYAEAYERGDDLPAIVVFYRFGGKNKRYVADGFHRVLARKHLAKKYPKDKRWQTIDAEVRDGGKREAVLYAAGSNMRHGVRRTNEDKRKAVITLLKDAEWRKWADSEIARQCGVSPPMVGKYREWLRPEKAATEEEVRSYIDRNGKERSMTVPRPLEDPDLGAKVRLEKCPFCGQMMRGHSRN